ncbi:MAG: alanine racemase [Candidatus Omnitrophica bacterium]|nr:alanine racemase [Candidatus Omnitrophota bacterium]
MTRPTKHLTWVEVDLKALKHNLSEIRRLTQRNLFVLPTRPYSKEERPPVMNVLTVVKADAYGHGMDRIAPLLDQSGVDFFGVSDVAEGIRIREIGIKKSVLLFESTLPDYAPEILRYRLMPAIGNWELATALNRAAEKAKRSIEAHVKIDTGMGRLGVWHAEAFAFIRRLMSLRRLRIMGLMTHFPSADTDKRFTLSQIKILYDLVIKLDLSGLVIPYIHAANSMGLAGYETRVLNLCRPGIMLYGLYPHAAARNAINLRPVMSVKSRVIFLKEVAKGRSISYGRTFFSQKDMRVAVIPLGYHDGYFRMFSNRASVLINGRHCPVLGTVTMDQIMVDVTDLTGVKLGTVVTVMGTQGKASISADELAQYGQTIPYEITCSFGSRLPRVYSA